jgi:hypothetical protein
MTVSTNGSVDLSLCGSRVGIATFYELDDQGSIPIGDKRFFFIYSVLTGSGAHQTPMDVGVLSPGVKLTTHLHLVPRSRMVELYLHCPILFN